MIQSAHIMGIGGFGMSAIARIMHAQGIAVTGCDLAESPLSEALRARGIPVHIGHDAAHLADVDALVISSAIPEDNAELLTAHERGIPVYKRADILGMLMQGKLGIAVAGTHGKTTTTAMIAHVLTQAGLDPTFIIGGVARDLGTNARAGRGQAFVIEADEYDGMFLGITPRIAVLTTLEMDHPDQFADLDEIRALFVRFLARIPADGLLLGGHDDPEVRSLMRHMRDHGTRTVGYGLKGGRWQAVGVSANDRGGMDFIARHPTYDDSFVRLGVPGAHNVQNALAAVAVGAAVGVKPEQAALALNSFSGVGRRFEVKGEVRGITIVDDYAHHPTAIRATIAAARSRYPNRRIWVVWQPHTFSRTKALLDEFAAALLDADRIIITDVFRSRDTEDFGITPQTVIDRMSNHPTAQHIGLLPDVVTYLQGELKPGAVVVVMSAGDGTRVASDLVEALRH